MRAAFRLELIVTPARNNMGYCHLCAAYGRLTLEHIPPQSAGNDRWTHCHTLYGMMIGSKFGKMPPLKDCRRGMGRHSLCERCNSFTAKYYNEAFATWTLQALELASKVDGEAYVLATFHEIKPLSILKQMATMAIATADFSDSTAIRRLRRFILQPFEPYLPSNYDFRIYLNPPRRGSPQDAKMLMPNRMATTATILDTTEGTATACFAEVALPPMGYLALFAESGFPLSKATAQLTNINHFGRYRWGEKADVHLTLAVRNPFGPVPGHYPRF